MARILTAACACCLALMLGLGLWHASRVAYYAGDDQLWRAHAARGLPAVWTEPSPFTHYRPVFGSWLRALQLVGADTPAGLLAATLLLYLAGSALVHFAFRPLLDAGSALIAATLVALHPARQQQLLWTSAGIDGMALLWSLLCIGLALRAQRAQEGSPARSLAVAGTTALAVLSKEIAVILPLLILLLPGAPSLRRRLAVAAASAAGAVAAGVAWLAVIRGGGRPGGLLSAAGSPSLLLYPTRLVWPGDLADWTHRAKLSHTFLPLLAATAALAVAFALLARAWRGKWGAPLGRTALLLLAAGALPWLVRQDDRAIGLGVVGLALLAAGAVGARPRRAALIVVALAACWLPLWLYWESRWTEASRQSLLVAQAHDTWRDAAPPDTLLVGLGAPAMVGWTCEVTGLAELDPRTLDLLSVLGPFPSPPVRVEADPAIGRLRITAGGDAVFRWGPVPAPGLGVMTVTVDDVGTRGATLDPAALRRVAERRGCTGVDLRRWDGQAYVPPD